MVTIEDRTRPFPGSAVWDAAEILWAFLQLEHAPAAADVIVALGCHDIGVAETAARLYHEGRAPLIVASGGVRPGTRDVLGGGEAVVFRDRMINVGVPAAVIMTEERARHTGENFTLTRDLLAAAGIRPASVAVACMPYMERRAWAICRAQWPEVTVWCASSRAGLADYVDRMWVRDALPAAAIIANLVGDLDRIWAYPAMGLAVEQPAPATVRAAFDMLVNAGYGTKRAPTTLLAPLPTPLTK
ncbi:YdcF family protein [Glycomyces sp. A-F 0318]|uniref:YdcF family protein n=1 Tax=Glycomyces amatae TaxID=2881355 RepID=UPI001E406E13|nr:YdcF family protein [Glycomyces amatae]MCD0446276.1 YdcF family protein [Glycomyces amatae]